MTDIGSYVSVDYIIRETGVVSEMGLQCGILVNDKDQKIILIQHLNNKNNEKYPNYWDEKSIGMLHYCGTNKGQTKEFNRQNLNSKLNGALNDGKYPIYVYVRYPGPKYRFMGRFTRLPKYDEELNYHEKVIYRFGLISNNIDATESIIRELILENNTI